MAGTSPAMTTDSSLSETVLLTIRYSLLTPLNRIPAEHVARPLERRQRRFECVPELRIERLRGPAVGAMNRADGTRLAKQEYLVVAHPENLSGDSCGAARSKINDQRR